jgi:Kdo2-lipid IVA lauroyltransferase/acyltransferase
LAQLLIGFMRLIARWPLPVVRALGALLGILLWLVAGKRRHIADVNLRMCFPEWSDAVRHRAVLRHFVAFGQSVLDRAWLWHAPEAVLRQRLQWTGDVQALTAPGPLVVFAPHFVGVDAGGMAVSQALRPAAVAFIFVAQSNAVIEQWVRTGRERMGNTRPYFRHEGMRKILAGLKRGDALHLSPDMDFNREESIFVPFMGVPAATVPSLSRLARVAGARVVPVVTRMTPGGYAIEAHAPLPDFPTEDLVADTTRMNELLAGYIRTMPEQYHWVHRRFKTRPEGEPGVY